MYNKYSKTIIEVLEWDRVYVIKYIVKSLNEFILISAVYTSHLKIIFSAAALNMNLYVQIYEHNLMINFLDINTASLNEKIKIYRL